MGTLDAILGAGLCVRVVPGVFPPRLAEALLLLTVDLFSDFASDSVGGVTVPREETLMGPPALDIEAVIIDGRGWLPGPLMGDNNGEAGGPLERPNTLLMIPSKSLAGRAEGTGLWAPPPGAGLPRAHSRAVAMRRAVSKPSERPSARERGSSRCAR